uniref:Uncharacterized protein n=1 Tax=Salix viminalis TaxID=40686 RepID=A0A6N2LAN3_SALVM
MEASSLSYLQALWPFMRRSSRQQTTIANPTTNETMQTQLPHHRDTSHRHPTHPNYNQRSPNPNPRQQISQQHTHQSHTTNSNTYHLLCPATNPKRAHPTFCHKPMA